MMTDTTFTSRLLGSAWPGHFNRPDRRGHAREHQEGRPAAVVGGRSEAGQGSADGAEGAGARPATQGCGAACRRAAAEPATRAGEPAVPAHRRRFRRYRRRLLERAHRSRCAIPSNIPAGPGHNWANAIAMATPIAHKGVMAGAKVQAMTMLDILLHPELVKKCLGLLQERADQGHASTRASCAPTTSPRSG